MKMKWLFTLVMLGLIGGFGLMGGVWSEASAQQTSPTIPTLPGQEIPTQTRPVGPNGDNVCFQPFPAQPTVRLCVYVPLEYGGSVITLSNPGATLTFPPLTPIYMLGQPFNITLARNTPPLDPTLLDPPLYFYLYYSDADVSGLNEPFLKYAVYKNGAWAFLPTTVLSAQNTALGVISSLDSPTTFAVFDAGTRKYYFPALFRYYTP